MCVAVMCVCVCGRKKNIVIMCTLKSFCGYGRVSVYVGDCVYEREREREREIGRE